MIALQDVQRTDQTPYVSSGGYSMPSVGSTFPAPAAPTAPATSPAPRAAPPSLVGAVVSGNTAAIINYFKPPATASDVHPSIPMGQSGGQIGGHAITPSMPGASGTPTGTPASGGSTSVPSVADDYFHQVLDLVASQLTTGQPSAAQQFAASPIALPSGSYAGADGSTTDSSGAAAPSTGRPWLGLIIIIAVAGAAYYWFVWRKKHGAAGAA